MTAPPHHNEKGIRAAVSSSFAPFQLRSTSAFEAHAMAIDNSVEQSNHFSKNKEPVTKDIERNMKIGHISNSREAIEKKQQIKKAFGGRVCGRRQRKRRLWQLPESSIHEYTKWIQEKPEADRTANEERFLWKCMIRSLGVIPFASNEGKKRPRQERIREFVERLESQVERSSLEEEFVRMYHLRKSQRKAAKMRQQQTQPTQDATVDKEPVVWWMRHDTNFDPEASTKHHRCTTIHHHHHRSSQKGLEPLAGLESLRESMKKMGLSSEKLKHVRFADLPRPEHERV